MLQPAQLKDAALRYANEIAEVRAFLVRGGVPVETPAALGDTALRLASDPAFHRDLGSHAWLLMYAGASVPEVLQVLAVAAAGETYASTSNEDDAHALLGFVLAQRKAFGERTQHPVALEDAETAASVLPAATVPSSAPLEETDSVEAEVNATAVPGPDAVRAAQPPAAPIVAAEPAEATAAAGTGPDPSRANWSSAAPEEEPVLPRRAAEDRTRNAAFTGRIVAVVVCVLGALLGGLWMYRESHDVEPVWTTSVEDGAPIVTPVLPGPGYATPPRNGRGAARSQSFPSRTEQAFRNLFRSAPHDAGTARNATNGGTSTPASPSANSPEVSAPAPLVRVPGDATGAGVRASTPLIASGAVAGKAGAVPVPSSVLAGRLGSPSANQADAEDDRVAGTKGYPHLLRRKPSLPDGTLMASATPALAAVGGNARVAAVPKGTVHSTSLGISAGNLVYAPDPAYPSNAALQHVSGQVTVQAMIDREGNVASARVVSGPPLLRDAALNAVQQWRYKPFLAGGKPQTSTATAVMDFQLQ